jgi:hypothetical protein
MTKDLLVRNVPKDLREWIDRKRQQQQMSQQEFVLSLLERASSPTPQTLRLPFEQIRAGHTASDLPFTFVDLFAGIGG